MDGMDDLVQFLRARLDEDEQAALSWPEGSRQWQTVGSRKLSYRNDSSEIVAAIDVSNASSLWNEQIYVKYDLDDAPEHIARHDPVRVLAEVEAKRKAIEMYERLDNIGSDDWTGLDAVEQILKAFGLAYVDHPGYRDTWRP